MDDPQVNENNSTRKTRKNREINAEFQTSSYQTEGVVGVIGIFSPFSYLCQNFHQKMPLRN